MTAHSTGELPTYRIRVQGRLGPEWSDRVGGMKVAFEEGACGAPCAELTGQLTDEAALMGVLEHLYNLRMPLLGVERVGRQPSGQASAAFAGRSMGLTPREILVARLLSERRSNQEIAAALGISPHTARHHTEQVLIKLGLHSRADVWDQLGGSP